MEWVKLGDISIIHDGKRVPLNNTQRLEKSTNPIYPYYGANGLVDYIDDYIFDEELPILCIAEDGGSWGLKEDCSYIIREKCWVNNHAHVITVIDNYNLNYINYYLNYSDLNKYITGTTRGKLTQKELKNIVIPNLSLEIQNKIVNKLKTIEKLIQTRQDQIQALDELVESLYYEFVFTNSDDYQKVKLDDIAKVRSSSRVFKKDLIDEGVPFYRGQEISMISKNIEFEPEFYISEELYNSMKEKSGIPKKGDLLLPSIANEGQIWVVDTDKEFYFKDGRVLWINLDENKEVNSIYLRYYLKYKLIQEFDSISSGSTFAELKIFILKKIDVLLPPIEKQNQFAAFVEKIEKQKQILNASLGDLTNLFDSLMQDAFDGSMTR